MRKEFYKKEKKEFEQQIIDIARVTRVMAGGKRMRFRACLVIGNQKGRIGFGMKKGADVTIAVNKANNQAMKNIITVPIVHDTIPHQVRQKFCGAEILIKPAPKGSGIIAGGVLRPVFKLAGIKNIVAKMLGSNGKLNNVQAAFKSLEALHDKNYYKKIRQG